MLPFQSRMYCSDLWDVIKTFMSTSKLLQGMFFFQHHAPISLGIALSCIVLLSLCFLISPTQWFESLNSTGDAPTPKHYTVAGSCICFSSNDGNSSFAAMTVCSVKSKLEADHQSEGIQGNDIPHTWCETCSRWGDANRASFFPHKFVLAST